MVLISLICNQSLQFFKFRFLFAELVSLYLECMLRVLVNVLVDVSLFLTSEIEITIAVMNKNLNVICRCSYGF